MKITLKALTSLIALVVLLTYSSCDKNSTPAPSVEEVQLGKLNSTWKLSEATLGTPAVSKKSDYANFQLVLSGTVGNADGFTYTTTGRPANSPWPANGNWVFGSSPETDIIRDPKKTADVLPITYSISADGKTLQLSFSFNGTGYPARTSVVTGNWVFTFTK